MWAWPGGRLPQESVPGLPVVRRYPQIPPGRRAAVVSLLTRVMTDPHLFIAYTERLADERLSSITESYPVEEKGEETGEEVAE